MLKQDEIEIIERTIGYVFADKRLLSQAFTRSSYHYEHLEEPDNELLEFIGDSVHSSIIVNILFDKYSTRDENGLRSRLHEGDFSKMKSALVNKDFLAKQMRELNLHIYLQVSVGDRLQGVNNGKSVLEDLFESIVGAVYLDSNCNLKTTEKVVRTLLEIDEVLKENDDNIRISYKNDVQEWCQKYGFGKPIYDTQQNSSGFISHCQVIGFETYGYGEGKNSKEAEISAAKDLLKVLNTINHAPTKIKVSLDNAINALQEYCQQRELMLPHYEDIGDQVNWDNSHKFTVRCYFLNHSTDGCGRTKKEAKKQAAYNMLIAIGLVA